MKVGSTTMIPKKTTVQPMAKYELSPPKKAKVTKSIENNRFVLFIDRKGVIHAVPNGLTGNS